MSIITILLIVLVVLALSGAGAGYYYAPADGGTSPIVSLLGVLALIGVVVVVFLLLTSWRFGVAVNPP